MMRSLCFAFFLAACGSTSIPSPTESTRTEIVGGEPSDATQDFVIVIANTTDAAGLECNANVVAPNLLVTARHCVGVLDKTQPVSCAIGTANFSSPKVTGNYAASHFTFWNDAALTKPFTGIHATQILDTGASTLCGEDLAFIVLDQPLTDLPVAAISTDAVTVGDLLTVVGSGEIDTSGTPATQRMQRTDVSVLAIGPTTLQANTQVVSAGEFATGVAFCHGDSGGPALDAQARIVGLVSRTSNCTTGPDVFTSLATHADLVTQAYAAAGYTPPTPDAGTDPDAADAGATQPSPGGCSTTRASRSDLGDWSWVALAIAAAVRRRQYCSTLQRRAS